MLLWNFDKVEWPYMYQCDFINKIFFLKKKKKFDKNRTIKSDLISNNEN